MSGSLGKIVSTILRPEILIAILIISTYCFVGTNNISGWTGPYLPASLICIFMLCVTQFIAKKYLIKDVNSANSRVGAYFVTGLSYLICTALMITFYDSTCLPFVSFTFFIGAMAMACANAYRKVSVHCGSAAIVATSFTILMWPFGAATFVIVPLLMWSRVKTESHDTFETIYGMMIGVITPVIIWAIIKIYDLNVVLL